VQRYRSRTFGFASRNFYASFLAAVEVDHHADLYFGPVALDEPVEYDTVVLDHYYPVSSIGRALGIDRETLRQHNLSLRPAVWNGSKYLPRDYELRIPSDRLTEAPEVALRTIPSDERFARQHRDRYYKVRRGDTLSKIARRYGVRERQLVSLNNLRSRHRIHAGQVLVLPDAAGSDIPRAEPEELPADGIYRVRRGDTIGIIARRFGTSEAQLVADNDLRNRHRIAVGQRLRLPGATPSVVAAADVDTESETTASDSPMPPAAEPVPTRDAPAKAIVAVAEVEAEVVAEVEADGDPFDADPAADLEIFVPLPDAAADPAPVADGSDDGEEAVYALVAPAVATTADHLPSLDPSNYAVTPKHRITVQAEETLGHYAEWLEVPTHRLRQLNRMSTGTPLAIGQRVHLDVSRVSPETFEERRLEYHQTLQAEFFASFVVADTETHVLRNGDTIWILARERFEVPVWLLRQYNPDLDFRSLKAGTSMIIPVIEPRES
jgi:membrane-bound lytic murein transglycosylase D